MSGNTQTVNNLIKPSINHCIFLTQTVLPEPDGPAICGQKHVFS